MMRILILILLTGCGSTLRVTHLDCALAFDECTESATDADGLEQCQQCRERCDHPHPVGRIPPAGWGVCP